MAFSLLKLEETHLRQLALSQIPPTLADRVEPEALPPHFVAERALQLFAGGTESIWACTYLIVRQRDQRIVGNCGFKTEPLSGRVEIGYGVAPSAQGHGAATEAVRQLVEIAFGGGAKEILAEVNPTNNASIKVVQRVGFIQGDSRLDEGGEHVVQWFLASNT